MMIPLLVAAMLVNAGATSASQPAEESGIGETLRQLRDLPAEEEDTVVPPLARVLLIEAKKQLGQVIQAVLNEAGSASGAASQIHDEILRRLRADGAVVGRATHSAAERRYGYLDSVDVDLSATHADLMAVTVTLSIPCGTDDVLFLFRRAQGQWELVFVEQAGPYEQINGAHAGVEYAVTKSKHEGSLVLVAIYNPPWCSSVLHPLHYVAYSIPPSTEPASVLVRGSLEDAVPSNGYDLEVTHSRFTVTYGATDNEGFRVQRVFTYELEGHGALRTKESPDG